MEFQIRPQLKYDYTFKKFGDEGRCQKHQQSSVKFRCKALQCLYGSADRDYAKRLTTEKESSVDISNSKHGAWAFFK